MVHPSRYEVYTKLQNCMVGVIWYRFVRYSGTDWSATLVPIHPLQWYRFADIISIDTIPEKLNLVVTLTEEG